MIEQFFYTPVPSLTWWLLGGAFLMAILSLFYGEAPLLRVGNSIPPEPAGGEGMSQPDDSVFPKVSVIVFARYDEEFLPLVLQNIYAQDYSDFEVIVVCETTAEGTEMLTEKYSRMFPGVYLTFIPPGSHNLSRKKLALTIGIKAAKGDVVLTTASNVFIPSDQWLRQMMAPFRRRHIDVVLGYSHLDFDELKGPWKWYRQFDDTVSAGRWLGYAMGGEPYRGDGSNLAFRRKVFFDHKGFASSNYLHTGDDDLFVNEISHGGNTAVVLSPETTLTLLWDDSANRVWGISKALYDFTARWLPRGPFYRAGFVSICQWLIPGLCVAASLVGLPNLIGAIAALLLYVLFELLQIRTYRRMAVRMEAVRLFWSLPLFRLARPVVNAIFRLDHRESNRKIYTWTR